LMRWLERATRRSIARLDAKSLRIASVQRLEVESDVWCLTVPESAEFSLENGAVVHNCSHPADAFRMMAVAWGERLEAAPPAQPRPLMVGPENTATLNDMWATHRPNRSARI
jgi:hypothetical protein